MSDEIFGLDRGAMLDSTALKFGKYKGRTPEAVSELDPKYLIWAYETVAQFPVCSDALYRSIGGKGKRAVKTEAAKKVEEKNASPAPGFDDMDDDIPF